LSVHTNNCAVTLCDLNYLLEVGDILKYSSSNNTTITHFYDTLKKNSFL